MKTCDKCMKHYICGKCKVFGAVGCIDDFQQKPQTNADKIRSMSDEELAELVGVTDVTICRWESGQREPIWSDFVKLCEVLGMELSWFTEKENENENK